MKRIFSKLTAFAAVAAISFGMTGCKDNDTPANDFSDEDIAGVIEQFVDHTVAPTYTALAAQAETLADQLAALRQNPTDDGLRQACETFLAAREQWEKSEAFLFGAAGDFGVDPHIDSWPLDESAFNTLMSNADMIDQLDGEEGDVVAGEQLGNALLGFHGLEYILFKNGQPKAASEIGEKQWIYAAAVAGDLRNRCYQLEVGWLGDDAPESHIAKLDDMELQYTVAGGDYSYGQNIKRAGNAGSTYTSRTAALISIIGGSIDIADEVGTSKINSAYEGEDVTYIESPYSQKSIIDFENNIRSIENVYYGGVEGQRNSGKSVQSYVKSLDASLDTKVVSAINNAIAKIQAMPAPFVLHYSEAANGEAVEACAALSEVLDEVVDAINKK